MFYKSGPYVVQVRKRSSFLLINTAVLTDTAKLLGFIKKKLCFMICSLNLRLTCRKVCLFN